MKFMEVKFIMKPIRILHILQRMEAGGTQALLMNIYRNIDRNKVQFDFFVEYMEKQFYDDEIISMGGKIYYNSVREDYNIFKFQNNLEKVLIENPEYRIIHVHAYTIGYFCLRVAKKCGVPVRIAHSHNNSMTYDIKRFIKAFMQKLYTIHATDLFACSEEAGKYLFKDKKFGVLKNAIDTEKFLANIDVRDDIRTELGITDKFVIGHVGRFHQQKNHEFLIDVFEEIHKLKKDAELLLIGSGPLEKQIKDKVEKKNLTKFVKFLGNRSDMDRIYQAMDVFVFPSYFEGLGIVAIEAQAAGIPLVCSEGLPKEANISPLYKKMYLNDGAQKWADVIIGEANNTLSHQNMREYVKKAGFDINSVSSKIQNYYLDKNRL